MKSEIILAVEIANSGLVNSQAPVNLLLKCIVDSEIVEKGRESDELVAIFNKSESKLF